MNISKRELIYTVSMLVVIAIVVFLLNLAILSSAWSVTLFRGNNKIKAVSIVQANKPRYLTSLQKKELVSLLNESEIMDKKNLTSSQSLASFKKISLHRFEDSSIEIIPIGTFHEKMALLVKEGAKETMIIEKESGQIQKAIIRACED